VAFILGSLVAPVLTRRIAAKHVMAAGLALSALGSAVLTQVGSGSLAVLMVGYLVFSLGLSLTFTLAVDLVVSSAPPERAGSASALAETGGELGGAVGIALLGSILTFLSRGAMADAAPAGVPLEAVQTLGSAVAAAEQLPGALGAQLLAASRDAFSHATAVTAAICAVAMLAASLSAALLIPDRKAGGQTDREPDRDIEAAADEGIAPGAATARS
jgi:MFS transporter, DHA2 family, multidrug resistance protein